MDSFLYNWQIREEWFEWCETISIEELTKKRIGGMQCILHNLFHVIDCEQIWINQMQGTPVIVKDINRISSLNDVRMFSDLTKSVTENFLKSHTPEGKDRILVIKSRNGTTKSFSFEKIITHIISHEIHHIGQLSIWSREIGVKPVSSDLLFRGLI